MLLQAGELHRGGGFQLGYLPGTSLALLRKQPLQRAELRRRHCVFSSLLGDE